MDLSTDDVKRLKSHFSRPLSMDDFVHVMMKCLYEHIHDEVSIYIHTRGRIFNIRIYIHTYMYRNMMI
jgi:hypothetical protein